MRPKAVIGIGFGDEGKGKVVSYLCSKAADSLVIRFCGGHQAGHHVVIDKHVDHVFSNFGSGTLHGVDTYWSRFCTIDPMGILNELDVLKEKGAHPLLYIDGFCPVTTPMDKWDNTDIQQHGTCGVGFGQTLRREKEKYSLLFSDLFDETIFGIKFGLLQKYYKVDRNNDNINYQKYLQSIDDFAIDCNTLISSKHVKISKGLPSGMYSDYIFEGAQGLLLDQDIGFFPHVTPSNTGTKNFEAIGLAGVDLYLVTRAYQTRHGNGPMTGGSSEHKIKPNPFEQQEENGYQGKFRIAPLDLSLLKYGIDKEQYEGSWSGTETLVITCMDLVQDYFCLLLQGGLVNCKSEKKFINTISNYLGIKNVTVSRTPYASEMEVLGNIEQDWPIMAFDS